MDWDAMDYNRLVTMNEMRAWLYEAGIDYPDDASREDLMKLIQLARDKQ